jgi:hypothetical protein
MSERNGDKSRFQIARKRGVHRRARIRALVASGTLQKPPAKAATAPKKTAR